MKNLKKFLKEKNQYLRMLNQKPLDIDSNLKEIALIVDTAASPENLHCDGEIPYSEGIKKYKLLVECAKEIREIDPTINFHEL